MRSKKNEALRAAAEKAAEIKLPWQPYFKFTSEHDYGCCFCVFGNISRRKMISFIMRVQTDAMHKDYQKSRFHCGKHALDYHAVFRDKTRCCDAARFQHFMGRLNKQ